MICGDVFVCTKSDFAQTNVLASHMVRTCSWGRLDSPNRTMPRLISRHTRHSETPCPVAQTSRSWEYRIVTSRRAERR